MRKRSRSRYRSRRTSWRRLTGAPIEPCAWDLPGCIGYVSCRAFTKSIAQHPLPRDFQLGSSASINASRQLDAGNQRQLRRRRRQVDAQGALRVSLRQNGGPPSGEDRPPRGTMSKSRSTSLPWSRTEKTRWPGSRSLPVPQTPVPRRRSPSAGTYDSARRPSPFGFGARPLEIDGRIGFQDGRAREEVVFVIGRRKTPRAADRR